MTDVLIRPMDERDREAVIDLLWELNRFEDAISQDRATRRADALACLNQTSRRLADAPGGAMLVAESERKVVGFACLLFDDGSAFVREDLRKHAYVVELVVAEALRGQGIGRRLLAECEALTRKAGLPVMAIGVLVGNDGARGLYERFGFAAHASEMLKRLA